MVTAEVNWMPFEIMLKTVNKASKNDRGDGINHLHRPQVTLNFTTLILIFFFLHVFPYLMNEIPNSYHKIPAHVIG